MILYAVGDIILSRKVEDVASRKGWKFFFQRVAETLKQGDIVFGNIDGPISQRGSPNPLKPKGSPYFRINPKAVEGLRCAGFNVLSLANNHVMDYGEEALIDTFRSLSEAGIEYVGAGQNEAEARTPLIIERDNLKVAFLAYTYTYPAASKNAGCALIREKNIKADIQRVKNKADIIAVSLHHGLEYSDYPVPAHISLAHKIIDWGAHLILGHHIHVLQGVETYKHGVIAYSLGNFVVDLSDSNTRKEALASCLLTKRGNITFDPENDTRPMESIILKCSLSERGVDKVELIPVYINEEYQPMILDNKRGQDISNRIEELSSNLKNKDMPIWQTLTEIHSQEYVMAAINKGWLRNLIRIHKIRRSHLSFLWDYLSHKFTLHP